MNKYRKLFKFNSINQTMSLREVRKKVFKKEEDIFAYPFRYISTIITMILAKTSITSLQVTWIHLIIGIISAVLFSFGKYNLAIIAFILYLISMILDFVDGEIARYKNIRSEVSIWLDHVSDNILLFLIIIGIAIGEFQINKDFSILIIALIALLITASMGIINISKRTSEKMKQSKAIVLPIKFRYVKKFHVGIFVLSSLILIISPIIKQVEIMFITYVIIMFFAMIKSFLNRIKLIKKEFNE